MKLVRSSQGIAPTLIVVRVGMGVSAEDAHDTILSTGLQFNHGDDQTNNDHQTQLATEEHSGTSVPMGGE